MAEITARGNPFKCEKDVCGNKGVKSELEK